MTAQLSNGDEDKDAIFGILKKETEHLTSEEISKRLLAQGIALSPKQITNILRHEKKTIHKKYPGQKKVRPAFRLMELGKKYLDARQLVPAEQVYGPNTPFDFFTDLNAILNKPYNILFLIEPYLSEELINIYLKKTKSKNIRILTNLCDKQRQAEFANIKPVLKKFAVQKGVAFEIRENQLVHDRAFFLDDAYAFVCGNSFTKAGNKPTYLIQLRVKGHEFKTIFEKLWANSTKII